MPFFCDDFNHIKNTVSSNKRTSLHNIIKLYAYFFLVNLQQLNRAEQNKKKHSTGYNKIILQIVQ